MTSPGCSKPPARTWAPVLEAPPIDCEPHAVVGVSRFVGRHDPQGVGDATAGRKGDNWSDYRGQRSGAIGHHCNET